MTLLGCFFIPIALLFFFFRPFYLLPLLLVASVFEAGSAINGEIGDFEFGISPFYLVEICIVIRLLFLAVPPTRLAKLLPTSDNPIRTTVWVVVIFWGWCFFSAFVMPHVFAGTLVSVPRAGGDEEFAPLTWSLSNLAQAGYLSLNVLTLVYALCSVRSLKQSKQLLSGLYIGMLLVIVIGYAQFIADKSGLSFPYDTLNNNPAYAQGSEQDLGAIRRVNSTFTEPSNAGSFLASVTCGLLASYFSGKRGWASALMLLAVTTTLFLTTSTTGFASLAIGLVILFFYYFNPWRDRSHGHKLSFRTVGVVLGVFLIIGAVLLFAPDLMDAIASQTVEKGETYSFWVRLANEIHSMELVLETYGLGVGMGSNRSSGLLPTMLSTVGFIGTGLFAWLLYTIGKAFPGKKGDGGLQFAYWALITMVISEIAAVPDINRPALWALLVLVISQLNVRLSTVRNSRPVRAPIARSLNPPVPRPSGIAPAEG